MDWKYFFRRWLWSCNPDKYADLSQEKLRRSCQRFFLVFLLLFILMAILFIPAFFIRAPLIEQRFDQFTTFELDGNFTSAGPITLLEKPRVLFDKNASDATGAQVIFGKDQIYFKNFYWFGSSSIDYEFVKSPQQLDNRLIIFLAAFLWPAIIFWAGIFVLVKISVLIGIFGILASLLAGLFRQEVKLKRAWQVGTYAAVPALTVEMLLLPFWYNGWIPFVIFVAFFAIGIALVAERKITRKG